MDVNAYILAADPAWIEASVRSYYEITGRIVVSYDEDARGWTGQPLDIEQCLRRLRAIDYANKLDFRPGHYARPEFFQRPMEGETFQRRSAFEQARVGADWVLQLDTDEVIGNTAIFSDCLAEADRCRRQALNYPSLWLYSRAFGPWYLEWCDRGWRRAPGYPGALAIRSDCSLTFARRVESGHFHVDLSREGSSGRVPNGVAVERVIGAAAAVWHLSMVRDEVWLRRKFLSFGHAHDRDWHPEVRGWLWAQRHPLLKVFLSQFSRGTYRRPLRLSRMPPRVRKLIAESCVADDASVNLHPTATAAGI